MKLFRKIRQKLLQQNSITRYLLYAIGEIVLVVIGILIAVSINDWNEQRKKNDMEMRFLSDLIKDLSLDSTRLATAKITSDLQVRHKGRLIDYWKGESITNDSLLLYVGSQWTTTYSFSIANTTLEEMKSSGNIGVIQNESLRRQILKTYNEYEEYEKQGVGIYGRMLEKSWEVIYDQVPNLFIEQLDLGTKPDFRKALQATEIQNRILGNHAITLNTAMQRAIEVNADCLNAVREEYRKLSKN